MVRVTNPASQLQALRDRGVENPAEFVALDAAVIDSTVRWFDSQRGRVGVGVLVRELRNGGRRPPRLATDTLEREAEYGRRVAAFCEANFECGAHPAAVAAVIRAQFIHGKSVEASVCRPFVAAAVERWDRVFGEPEPEQVAA